MTAPSRSTHPPLVCSSCRAQRSDCCAVPSDPDARCAEIHLQAHRVFEIPHQHLALLRCELLIKLTQRTEVLLFESAAVALQCVLQLAFNALRFCGKARRYLTHLCNPVGQPT